MMPRFCMPFAAILTCLALVSSDAQAQNDQAQNDGATDYVPEMAVAVMRSKPASMLQAPGMEYMPIEVAQAWSRQNFGVDPLTITEVKLVVGMPMPGTPPPFGVVVTLSEEFDPSNINPELLAEEGPIKVANHEVYVLGPQKTYLHSVNANTAIIASPGFFEMMLDAKEGVGPMSDLINRHPLGKNDGQVIVAIEPIRPILSAQLNQQADKFPPELEGVNKVPELLDAIVYENAVKGNSNWISLQMVCDDASSAEELSEVVERGIKFGRVMVLSAMTNDICEEGRMADAQRAYATRIVSHFADLIMPVQDNNRLVIEADVPVSMAHTGILIGLLLPAVQAAREAARRMTASNNLKQIGLAMHNHHAAYKTWPANIADKDGKPLLSWRVAILPFIEQQELYEQFHLDEPWDSEHNRKLTDQIPTVYVEPSLPLQGGLTVFQAAANEGMALEAGRENRIRDIIDGTSNTIMVVEANERHAVQWTKPQDVDLNVDQPIMQMGRAHPGGFQVLFADGSVRFIVHGIDQNLFGALLTRGGGENVAGGF